MKAADFCRLLGYLLIAWLGTAVSLQAAPLRQTAAEFVVAPDGDDGQDGSAAAPWRTIQHGVDQLQPGDTLTIRGGLYAEAVRITRAGRAGAPITIRSAAGETAVLDGQSLIVPDEDSGLITIDSQQYIRIIGLELRNYQTADPERTPMGIFVTGNAGFIRLINNHIHHIATNGGAAGNAHGIAVYGTDSQRPISDLRISGNRLHDLHLGNSEALVLNGNVQDFLINQNLIFNSDNIGIDLIGFEGTADDDAVDQARDGVVRDNRIFNIDTRDNPAYDGEASAAGIYVDGGTRIEIRNNLVVQANIGIEIASENRGRATSAVRVIGNTLVRNHLTGLAMGGYDRFRGATIDCVVSRNQLFQNDTLQDGNGEIMLQYDIRQNEISHNLLVANEQGLFISNPYAKNEGNVVDFNIYAAPGATDAAWEWQETVYSRFDAYQTGTGNDAHGVFAGP